jgi:hypothetical protein
MPFLPNDFSDLEVEDADEGTLKMSSRLVSMSCSALSPKPSNGAVSCSSGTGVTALKARSLGRSRDRPADSFGKLTTYFHAHQADQAAEEGGLVAGNGAEDVTSHGPCPGLVLKRGSRTGYYVVYFFGAESGTAVFFSSGK